MKVTLRNRGNVKLVKLPPGDEMNTFNTLITESKFLSLGAGELKGRI
jgi:hypothetical protein